MRNLLRRSQPPKVIHESKRGARGLGVIAVYLWTWSRPDHHGGLLPVDPSEGVDPRFPAKSIDGPGTRLAEPDPDLQHHLGIFHRHPRAWLLEERISLSRPG